MSASKEMQVLCGPLLRYTYMDYATNVWHGSVLLVVSNSSDRPPILHLTPEHFPDHSEHITGALIQKVDNDQGGRTFWRFALTVPLADNDQRVDYQIKLFKQDSRCCNASFFVPAKEESMRILCHSCNGYSLGVKPGTYAGATLWRDVMRIHVQRPFHVMVGGGDQVYSDEVRVSGPLKAWATHLSPRKRAKLQVTEQFGKDVDEWYFNNYCDWYTGEPFKDAAASIPAVQIFDDHDIIDGYGSYPDRFMRAPVFLEVGKVAWKYYMLFQQHTPPEGEKEEDPSWVIGSQKGLYIQHPSRSICTTFGKRIVFYGLDCRVDRTIDRVCYESTYQLMFDRLDKVVNEETKHVFLLLGVPIAYPRLVWLESLLSTYTIAPLRWLNKVFGVAGGVFNKFDGSAELLDDLNDHWCAGTHKRERNELVRRLQAFASRRRIRITILSGDVHLACIGRFFSKESLSIPQNVDHRYMVNIVTSAITNTPPPNAVANLLNKRNKLHHLDDDTDENLMDIFYENPDGKVNVMNYTTLPARNYCIITEHAGLAAEKYHWNTHASEPGTELAQPNGHKGEGPESHKAETQDNSNASGSKTEANGSAQHKDSGNGGTEKLLPACKQKGSFNDPSAQAPLQGTMREFALDVVIRAEVDPKDPEGRTRAYGFAIPALEIPKAGH